MKTIKHLTCTGLLLLAATQALPSMASEVKNTESPIETNRAKKNTGESVSLQAQPETEAFPSFSPRFGANFTTSGAGFDEFASFEAFIPILQSPGKNLTFLEAKLLWTTELGTLGGNILLGHRFLSDSAKSVVGGYVSYDSRNTGETVFNQLGAGFESLSDSLDFRANVYLPIGNTNFVLASANPGTFAFRGNALEIDRIQLVQQALTGFDAEVGTVLASLGSGSLRGYAGLYYYTSQDIDGFVGVRGRLVARPNDNLVAGLTLQSDSVFDTRLVFTIGANLSPGSSTKRSKNSVLARMTESPERQSNITVDDVLVKDSVAAIDPATGLAYNFQHVNLGNGNSNGTFESPFGTLQAALDVAKPGDIVYVRSGTNPGVPAFTIPDGVQVISSAVPIEMKTQLGAIKLPSSGSGVLPLIKDTVTLGNNTSLSGFNIANASGVGIEGININNVSIKNNIITNSAEQGIHLEEVTGKVEITDNLVSGTQFGSGIRLVNRIGNINLKIVNNTVEKADNVGIYTSFEADATGTVEISKNTTAQNGYDGISADLTNNSKATFNISANNTFQNASNGISIYSEGNSEFNVNILNNIAVDNGSIEYTDEIGSNGIFIGAFDSSKMSANILNNTTNKNEYLGINFQVSSNITAIANISGNRSEENQLGGIALIFFDNGQGSVNMINNIVSKNQDSGLQLILENNANVTANISQNTAFGHTELDTDGIFIYLADNAQANVRVTDNIITKNFRGITSGSNDDAKLKIILEGNNVTDNLTEGIAITGDSDPKREELGVNRTFATIHNNTTINNNTSGQGFGDLSVATFSDGSYICLQARNNTIGTLALADTAAPELGAPFNADPLEYLAGMVVLELPNVFSTNSIKNQNPANSFVWSGITITTCN